MQKLLAFPLLYVLLWCGSAAYLAVKGADWTFPIVSLAIFGVALSGLAYFLTKRAEPQPLEVTRPRLELSAVLIYLAVYAILFLGFGMTMVRAVFPPGREQDLLVLAAKLVANVVAPVILLSALGVRLAPLFSARVDKPGFWPTLIVLSTVLIGLLSVVTPSLTQIGALHPALGVLAWAAPASFVWVALEAGLTEEFLFRAVLQSRLSAVLKTEAGAVVIGAVLFGLAHVPGLFLRGTPDTEGYSKDILQIAAYSIAALSPLAILFGVVWARTRSLLLVVLLHAVVDVLPNMPDFLKVWAL